MSYESDLEELKKKTAKALKKRRLAVADLDSLCERVMNRTKRYQFVWLNLVNHNRRFYANEKDMWFLRNFLDLLLLAQFHRLFIKATHKIRLEAYDRRIKYS